MILIQNVPLNWLLPKCALAIHCGDAYTTCECLHAGIPSIIFYGLQDQPFWGFRVAELGVGVENPLSLRELNPSVLESFITQVNTPEFKKRAQSLASDLKEENGIEKAINSFLKIYSKTRNCGIELHWVKDEDAPNCFDCKTVFTLLNRRHHCRSCGNIFCIDCLAARKLPNYSKEEMVCRKCWDARSNLETGNIAQEELNKLSTKK